MSQDQMNDRLSKAAGNSVAESLLRQRIDVLRSRVPPVFADSPVELTWGTANVHISDMQLLELASVSQGQIISLGDSWFDYLIYDVIDRLYDLGYEVNNVAHQGSTLEQISDEKNSPQLTEFQQMVTKFKKKPAPTAILLSGGGNDVVDDGALQFLLNAASVGQPHLIEAKLADVVDTKMRAALIRTLSAVTKICGDELNKTIVPILLHGYDYPIPDGRPVDILFYHKGPWLKPSFDLKGYTLDEARQVMQVLIDRMNEMQLDVLKDPDFKHVKHVNLRNTLDAADHTTMWANELHPSIKGFKLIAEKFAAVLKTL